MKPTADISVVILAGGRQPQLRRCLEALEDGTRVPAEIIIVNNDPSGAIDLLLRDYNGPLNIRSIPGLIGGYAESRNQGVAATTTTNVAFLDDDCLADRWWIEKLTQALERYEAVGGPVLPARDHRTPPDFSPELNWLVGLSTPLMWSELGGKVEIPSTSNVAFRKSVWERHPFQEIGGKLTSTSDNANYLVGREDAEWWRRLRSVGVRTTMEYRAIVWHDFDRRRYSAEATLSRAEKDGTAHWRRERPRHELQHAATDVLHYPVRILHDLFYSADDYRTIRRKHRAWMRRQLALLENAVDDEHNDFTPQQRAALYLRAGAKLIADAAKPAARHAASFSHHNLKKIRPIPTVDDPPAAVTVVCYDFLGDAVLTLPMIGELRRAFPLTKINIICGEVAAPIYSSLSSVDHVEVLPSGLRQSNPRHAALVYQTMKRTDPDVIILTYFHQAPPIGLFAATDAPVICWDNDNGMRQRTWPELASAVVPKSLKKAEIAELMNLLAPMRVPTRLRRPTFSPPKAVRERVAEILAKLSVNNNEYAVVHIDADENTRKYWPTQNYEQVARALTEELNLHVFFVGTRRGKRHTEFFNLPPRWTSLHGMLDAAQLAALQQDARICIGVDSGPQHLAQATGAPTVILFEAVQHARWKPLPRIETDANNPIPFTTIVAPNASQDWLFCELDRLPINEQIARITPDSVIHAVRTMLT